MSNLTQAQVNSGFDSILKLLDSHDLSDPNLDRALRAWDQLGSTYLGQKMRAGFEHLKNVNDKDKADIDKYFREELTPVYNDRSFQVIQKMLSIPAMVSFIEKNYGTYLLQTLKCTVQSTDPRVTDLRVEESKAGADYQAWFANAKIPFEGRDLTTTEISKFLESESAEQRKSAFLAQRRFFVKNRDVIQAFASRLFEIRQKIAEKLGDKNYIPQAYQNRRRTEYTVNDVASYRELILKHVVPVQTELHKEQAHALGTPTLKIWDHLYNPQCNLPMGIAKVESQIECAQRVFDSLSSRLSSHFSMMREADLIDLENRPGKAAGAFCTRFMDKKQVAIFCNSTGSSDDVRTLMHEMGHAFQGWESIKAQPLAIMTYCTSDVAEVHSFGMEYLSLPHLGHFFKPEHLEKYSKKQIQSSVELLTYTCVGDEFQQWVYEHPGHSADERDRAWNRIFKKYKPSVDFDGFEAEAATRWYYQLHVFLYPFYYIDYGLAQIAALQLAETAQRDKEGALKTYIKLCELGGQYGMNKTYELAGMASPFLESTIKNIAHYLVKQIH